MLVLISMNSMNEKGKKIIYKYVNFQIIEIGVKMKSW